MHGTPPTPSAAQGLLRDKLELEKVDAGEGKTRYTIKPLDGELPFDKVRAWVL